MAINLDKVANKISGIINDFRDGISDQDETEQALRDAFLDVVEQKIDGDKAEIERLQTAYHTESSEVCRVLASALNIEQGDLTQTALADMAKAEIERLNCHIAELEGDDLLIKRFVDLAESREPFLPEDKAWFNKHLEEMKKHVRERVEYYNDLDLYWSEMKPFEGEI